MSEGISDQDPRMRVAFVGTHVPRRCGIATFANDLVEAVSVIEPDVDCWAVAINDRPAGYPYHRRVRFEVQQQELSDYARAADFLHGSGVDVVCLQHEFGIYGGDDGQHIVQLLRRLRVPVVTTLHTVLREPTDSQRKTLLKIAHLSDRLVILAQRAATFLRRIYDVPESLISHIPHGVPDAPIAEPIEYKDRFHVAGKKVILTFGLLSPDKGIETMIEALPSVVAAHPDIVYVVLGATHPQVKMHNGESYRKGLERRALESGVADHVIFENRFVELPELCDYLRAADVYVTPYPKESQIVSGTLAYAMGFGNAVVATPYCYAQEMLADDRGRLVPFQDPHALAGTIIDLFDNEAERYRMRKCAYAFTRRMIWPEVARQYLELFREVQAPSGFEASAANMGRNAPLQKLEPGSAAPLRAQ